MTRADTTDRPSILVVDDEPDLRELLESALADSNYDIRCASDGEQALAAIREHHPHAVVLDINMPRLDGFGVLKALAGFPLLNRPRVLVLTARYAVEDVDRSLALGASDYLAKPFTIPVLRARVERLLVGRI